MWLPFNKSMLLLVTTNLELARENPERWDSWLLTLARTRTRTRTLSPTSTPSPSLTLATSPNH